MVNMHIFSQNCLKFYIKTIYYKRIKNEEKVHTKFTHSRQLELYSLINWLLFFEVTKCWWYRSKHNNDKIGCFHPICFLILFLHFQCHQLFTSFTGVFSNQKWKGNICNLEISINVLKFKRDNTFILRCYGNLLSCQFRV